MSVAYTDRPLIERPLAFPRRATGQDPLLVGLYLEIGAYLVTLILCGILFIAGGMSSIINLFAPLVITVAPAATNYRMLRADRNAMLTPLFGVRLIAMVMLGLGGLFHSIAPASIRDLMDYVYLTGPDDDSKVYLVWLVGMALLMLGIAAGVRLSSQPPDRDQGHSRSDTWSWQPAALTFLVGFTCDTTMVLMQSFGMALPVPGFLSTIFTAISLTGLFFLGEQVGRSAAARAICVAALAMSVLLGLLTMNKTVALLPTLILTLGFLRGRFSARRLLLSSVAVTALYFTISPIVTYSRSRDFSAHSTLGSGSVADRFDYVRDYLDGDRIDQDAENTNSYSMSRLDYVMPASFVIGQYDRGVPAQEIVNSGYMLIPRILWPKKPITTGAGMEVNYLLGNQSTNQIAVTMFGDVYWNLGWPGLALMLIGGVFMGVGTVVTRRILRNGDWLMMPYVFASFRFSLTLDSNFASAMMVGIIMAFALFWGLRCMRVILPTRLGGAASNVQRDLPSIATSAG